MSAFNFDELVWLDEASSPFGVRCLDCRKFSQTMLAGLRDRNDVSLFISLRKSVGRQYIGKLPLNRVTAHCDLSYPLPGRPKDGPLFIADVLEDMWDIFLQGDYLFIARSWDARLVFRAEIAFSETQSSISVIDANSQWSSPDPALIVRQLDFLVKSHLCKREALHPLPATVPSDNKSIAMYSFRQHGRWAAFATYEDTSRIQMT